MKKETGIMVDEVSGKRYKLLRWNQKPNREKGDEVQCSNSEWTLTAQFGLATVKRIHNYGFSNQKFRRPLPA